MMKIKKGFILILVIMILLWQDVGFSLSDSTLRPPLATSKTAKELASARSLEKTPEQIIAELDASDRVFWLHLKDNPKSREIMQKRIRSLLEDKNLAQLIKKGLKELIKTKNLELTEEDVENCSIFMFGDILRNPAALGADDIDILIIVDSLIGTEAQKIRNLIIGNELPTLPVSIKSTQDLDKVVQYKGSAPFTLRELIGLLSLNAGVVIHGSSPIEKTNVPDENIIKQAGNLIEDGFRYDEEFMGEFGDSRKEWQRLFEAYLYLYPLFAEHMPEANEEISRDFLDGLDVRTYCARFYNGEMENWPWRSPGGINKLYIFGQYLKEKAENLRLTLGRPGSASPASLASNTSVKMERRAVEIKKVARALTRKLKRRPNIRETAEAMPSLRTSRNPVALLYKYFEEHNLRPSDFGIGRFSGKANLVIRKNFLFAGTRVFLPPQMSSRVMISAKNTPISEEKDIELLDRKNPQNRLSLGHIKESDILRLSYFQPSGEEVSLDIKNISARTSVTLALNPVFSDFYDTLFSIPIDQSEERLKAVAGHLRNKKFGIHNEQEERGINFHGHLLLPSWYRTHPGRIRIYRDRGSDARFILLEDISNPRNVVGYEWREGRIIPLEQGQQIESGWSINGLPGYYLAKSSLFRAFDESLDKSIEVKIARPDDVRLSDIAMGTGRFSFRVARGVKRGVRIISFEGQRSKENLVRDDRLRYPVRIVRPDDNTEIKIGYRDPAVQGEFIVEGLSWEDGAPLVLKGSATYDKERTGYFNLSTIVEMVRQGLLPGIKASRWLPETFGFNPGPEDPRLRNPIRDYKIETSSSGEKVLVRGVFVDPETFQPWQGKEASESTVASMLGSAKEALVCQ